VKYNQYEVARPTFFKRLQECEKADNSHGDKATTDDVSGSRKVVLDVFCSAKEMFLNL
jgi:hypothetical protein